MKIWIVSIPEEEASDATSFGYDIYHYVAVAVFKTELEALEFRDKQDATARIAELELKD